MSLKPRFPREMSPRGRSARPACLFNEKTSRLAGTALRHRARCVRPPAILFPAAGACGRRNDRHVVRNALRPTREVGAVHEADGRNRWTVIGGRQHVHGDRPTRWRCAAARGSRRPPFSSVNPATRLRISAGDKSQGLDLGRRHPECATQLLDQRVRPALRLFRLVGPLRLRARVGRKPGAGRQEQSQHHGNPPRRGLRLRRAGVGLLHAISRCRLRN